MVDYEALDAHILGVIAKTTDDAQQIRSAMESDDPALRKSAAANRHAPHDVLAAALDDEVQAVHNAAVWNRSLPAEVIEEAFSAHPKLRKSLIQHDNVPVSVLEAAFDQRTTDVRVAAVRHPRAPVELLARAIDDSSERVRRAAFANPNATAEMVAMAADDETPDVRRIAMQSEHADQETLWKGIRDEDWGVRSAAAGNPNASRAMLEVAAQDDAFYSRVEASVHPNATAAIRQMAAVGGDQRAQAAKRRAKTKHSRAQPSKADTQKAKEQAVQLTYSDLLRTNLADRARQLTPQDFLAVSKRIDARVDQVVGTGYSPSLFGWFSHLQRGLCNEALGVKGNAPQHPVAMHGPEFVLVAEPSFNAIDAELSLATLTELERSLREPPQPPYVSELLQNEATDLAALGESAWVIADVLASGAESLNETQRLADSNGRRRRAGTLQGALPDAILDPLPILELELWPDDIQTQESQKRQTLYSIHVALTYRVAVVSFALFDRKR